MTRHINAESLEKLKNFECVGGKPNLKAYQDGGGVWTIGFGHTKGVKRGQVITPEQAEAYLREDLAWAEKAVETGVKVPLTDNQFGALVSFVFNVGEAAFKKSTLLKKLNQGDYNAVPKQLLRWCNDNGERVQGLYNRRVAEGGLWAKGQFVSSAGPTDPKTTNHADVLKKTGAGTVIGGVTTGSAIETLSPLAGSSRVIQAVVVGLVLIGVCLSLYGVWKANRGE